jgi:hypothetical protein
VKLIMNKQIKKILLMTGLLNALIGVQVVAATSATANIVTVNVQYVTGTIFLARTIGEEYGVMTIGGVYGVWYNANWHIPVGGRICTVVVTNAGDSVTVYQAEPTTSWAKITYWGDYTDIGSTSDGSVKYIGTIIVKEDVLRPVVDACMHWQK